MPALPRGRGSLRPYSLMTLPPLAVLTRPAGRNDALAQALRAEGWDVLDLPALRIVPLPADADTLARPQGHDLAVFVSGTAARLYLGQLRDVAGMQQWPAEVAAACVGPGTARALRDSPLWNPAAELLHPGPQDGSYDSEALWQILQERGLRPRRVLLVRGTAGRDWLAGRLAGQGAQVLPYAVYAREPAPWPAAAVAALAARRDAGGQAHWLVTSGEGLAALREQARQAGLLPWWLGGRFVATHPRLAERLAAEDGAPAPGMVKICLPEDAAIVQAFRSR